MDTTETKLSHVAVNDEGNHFRDIPNIYPTTTENSDQLVKPVFKVPAIPLKKNSGRYNVTSNSNKILKENVPSAIFKSIDPSIHINENRSSQFKKPDITSTKISKLRFNDFTRVIPTLLPERNRYKVTKKKQSTRNNKAASDLFKFKKNALSHPTSISDTDEEPSAIGQAWKKAIAYAKNLSPTSSNSTTEFHKDVDLTKEKGLLVSLETGFKSSEEIAAGKKETVDDGGSENPTGRDVYSKKRSLILHNEFSKAKRHKNKHIYFDDDGNEIVECNKTNSQATDLIQSSADDETMVEIPPIISSHFNGKSSVRYPYKKEKKMFRNKVILSSLPREIANDSQLEKYWHKRFSLFNLYDFGIKLDRESWFSVTPEKIADRIAKRCKCDIIIDGCCGAGGNTIQFAMTCEKVIAIDIDPKKIEMAKHNATIYGVTHRIEFIVGDFFALVDSFKADVIFLSPPWGGPEYLKKGLFDVEAGLTPFSASKLLNISRKITQNIVIYLPRNSDTRQLAKLAGPERPVEIEQCSLDGKLIAITAYYGTLFSK